MTVDVAYDGTYTPAAPVVPVRLARPGSTATLAVAMLLDTGADCSVVPASLARALGLPRVGRVAVRGVTGVPLVAPLCAAVVRFAARERTVEVAAFGDEAILGRDLAATLVARLDGPRARLRISEPRRRAKARRP